MMRLVRYVKMGKRRELAQIKYQIENGLMLDGFGWMYCSVIKDSCFNPDGECYCCDAPGKRKEIRARISRAKWECQQALLDFVYYRKEKECLS
jgi:hypothetical protein